MSETKPTPEQAIVDVPSEATMRLMEAAPDLYEACVAIVQWGFCPSCGCDLCNTEGCPWCKRITAVREAVKKAEGRS